MVWLINVLSWPIRKIKQEIKFRKRLKELRDQDPFVYEDRQERNIWKQLRTTTTDMIYKRYIQK